jgi:hypothetical protein
MLRLTCLGHATLLVEAGQTKILCDPIFSDEISGGGNFMYPFRRVALRELGQPDAVLISHHHSDHFSLPEIARLADHRRLRFVAPLGSPVVEQLRASGHPRVDVVSAGDRLQIGDVTVTATPSNVDFPEVGFAFQHGQSSALDLVDTRLEGITGRLLAALPRPPDLVLAPFQAGGYVSFWPLRVGGPPPGLFDQVRAWSRHYLVDLLDSLVALSPKLCASFADGFLYRDQAMNCWNFPLSERCFRRQLAKRGIRGVTSRAGMVFALDAGRVEIAEAPASLVEVSFLPPWSRRFNPDARFSEEPLSCASLLEPARVSPVVAKWPLSELGAALESILGATTNPRPDDAISALLNDWFLELCISGGPARYLSPQLTPGRPARLAAGGARPAGRRFGVRMHASDLALVLAGVLDPEHVKFSAALRFFCPEVVPDYEQWMARVLVPFHLLIRAATPGTGPETGAHHADSIAAPL